MATTEVKLSFDDLPGLERSSGSPAGSIASMAEDDSIDNTTFNRSRKEASVMNGSDDEDDDDDTYGGMELDFDDASTIATTFTCLQHQYQQQKQVKLEGIFEQLGYKLDGDDDEKTKAWEKLSKDELLQLLAALRVDLGGNEGGGGGNNNTKSAMKKSDNKKSSAGSTPFKVPVPPWSGGILEEVDEDEEGTRASEYDVQVKVDDSGNEEYSVKVPPWAAEKQ